VVPGLQEMVDGMRAPGLWKWGCVTMASQKPTRAKQFSHVQTARGKLINCHSHADDDDDGGGDGLDGWDPS